ncbi:hypothetical protein A7X95_05960 [Candidatus Nitrosopelagicus brevis]|uniref:D,D-heptose 1,7-bisphosphate phosphatase n=1 Tax=Candidatus Nitrosopelagicus brevis TaxID=1410606 RepID=A0A0A7V0M4_9ARCH|nr:HAD family hydrolase [Candidatus Nitrosopelagicus brevis]AJA92433.1 D,D-heptose 1,7-bisphosphate phosphatase [Candidatus Nitrosopelagicus brevis]MAR69748.1 HAD family hydrolase [Nitrospina sp.]PTL87434.1 hypothetical protein A7X95_05960 [Candidatus Nitrosopelagicus brevis]|tara:strand:+ start:14519 stop:15022 length:504 start_codon:yes stop_codon:yes gene_type:complete
MSRAAIFLDRDGVINQKRDDYVKNISELEIFEYVPNAINLLKKNNFLIILITNQSIINRKIVTLDTLNAIHKKLQNFLNEHNTSIDAIYFCPHKPDENCDCRKPQPGLILKATKEFDINLEESWFIGDSQTDIEAANLANCNSFLVNDSHNLMYAAQEIIKLKNSSV